MFKTHRTYTLRTGVKNNAIAVLNWNNGQNVCVIYHSTPVVQKEGKKIVITNGGWDTVSTRAVINRALEQMCASKAYLFRKRGVTMLHHNGMETEFNGTAILKSFYQSVGVA